jgi:hypothetical protein
MGVRSTIVRANRKRRRKEGGTGHVKRKDKICKKESIKSAGGKCSEEGPSRRGEK